MKSIAFVLLILFRLAGASAQVTLIKGAPNQVFDLSCTQCSLAVEDIALWKGVKVLPYHKTKSGLVNLLHWKYYDTILKTEVVTAHELPWEKCTQLFDVLNDQDTLSLQVNLNWTDSTGQSQRIFLLLGGIQKNQLSQLPLESVFEAGAVTSQHFSAIAQIRQADGKTETYETISGEMSLTMFDPKTGTLGGSFEFAGNCIGWLKRGTFQNGVFEKK